MNLVGRIFVVLILIMSIVFATFSIMVYATHTNWREEIMRTAAEVRGNQTLGYKERLKEAREENAKLTNDRNEMELQLTAEKTAKIQALAKLEAANGALTTENAEKSKQLAAKEKELEANTNALHVAQNNLSNLTAEVQKLRDDIAASQRETDEQIKKSTDLADKLAVASGVLANLQERNTQLTMDVSKAKTILKGLGMSIEDPADASTIPVAGIITAVSTSKVELSIGTDDGVRIGQQLDIYRRDKYVGRVKVVEVKADTAVAAILPEYQQFPIQRGDNVGSQLQSRVSQASHTSG
jgi:septal ring factor EnvC (AmiA/AmiB activator)